MMGSNAGEKQYMEMLPGLGVLGNKSQNPE